MLMGFNFMVINGVNACGPVIVRCRGPNDEKSVHKPYQSQLLELCSPTSLSWGPHIVGFNPILMGSNWILKGLDLGQLDLRTLQQDILNICVFHLGMFLVSHMVKYCVYLIQQCLADTCLKLFGPKDFKILLVQPVRKDQKERPSCT